MGLLSFLGIGGSKPTQPATEVQPAPALDLTGMMYSPEFVQKRVDVIREQLVHLREHAATIKENEKDPDGEIELLTDAACTQVEKVLQNLKKDTDDMARTGLTLESLTPLVKLMAGCAKASSIGDGGVLSQSLAAAKRGLESTSRGFKQLAEGVMQLDDTIEVAGLANVVERLTGPDGKR